MIAYYFGRAAGSIISLLNYLDSEMIKISGFVLRFLAGADITAQLEAWNIQVEKKDKVYYLTGKVRTAIHRRLLCLFSDGSLGHSEFFLKKTTINLERRQIKFCERCIKGCGCDAENLFSIFIGILRWGGNESF